MKKRILFIAAAILATAFIFYNSMQTADISSGSSKIFSDLLEKALTKAGVDFHHISPVFIVRKAAHIAEFALQGFFLAGCFKGKYSKRIIYILFFGLLTACADEYIQFFTDGRASMVQDIFIDFAGTAAAAAISGFFY